MAILAPRDGLRASRCRAQAPLGQGWVSPEPLHYSHSFLNFNVHTTCVHVVCFLLLVVDPFLSSYRRQCCRGSGTRSPPCFGNTDITALPYPNPSSVSGTPSYVHPGQAVHIPQPLGTLWLL